MTNKEIIKVLKNEIIRLIKETAKDGNLSKLAAVLEVLYLSDEQIIQRGIKVISRFPDPIGNKELLFQIINKDKEVKEYVIENKQASSRHKEQQFNKKIADSLIDKNARNGKQGKGPNGSFR